MAIAPALPALLPHSAEQRRTMVDRQVRTYDVTDQVVTGRMIAVPREFFVPEALRPAAYSDLSIEVPLADGAGMRVMLPPLVVGRMMQFARPKPTDRVLDLAGGMGYTAALFAGLVENVLAVESDADLADTAGHLLRAAGLHNARAVHGSLLTAAKGQGPFDIIFVNGCAETGLETLAKLLAPEGRIIAIVPKSTGLTAAAEIEQQGDDVSIRPLFDAQAPVLAEFRRQPEFVL